MKNLILLLSLIFISGFTKSQDLFDQTGRFIEVTGSAEMEVEPDQIQFIIGIEEYWSEEFDKKADFKDYVTKVPITTIEDSLLKDLELIGITQESIRLIEVGNYWRNMGKEFLKQKRFLLKLDSFDELNNITKSINTLGISYMHIDQLNNDNISEFRKQVKIMALKAAKDKAEYLLQSLDLELGQVISIEELPDGNQSWRRNDERSNLVMSSHEDAGIRSVKKINLRYEIRAKFEIFD